MEIDITDVVTKLDMFGYTIQESDSGTLRLAAHSVVRYIKNFCNIKEVPSELYYTAVEMTAGVFLKTKLSIGEKVNSLIDFDLCNVSSIAEGDVSVSFGSDKNNSTNRYIAFIDNLCNKDKELVKFRKLRW